MPTGRWEDSIGINLKEIGVNTRNFMDSGRDRDCLRALINALLKTSGSKALRTKTIKLTAHNMSSEPKGDDSVRIEQHDL